MAEPGAGDGPADVGGEEGASFSQNEKPDLTMGLMCLFQPVVEQIDLSVQGVCVCLGVCHNGAHVTSVLRRDESLRLTSLVL